MKLACTKGDNDSKTLIEKHAPEMARMLKKEKQWDKPSLCINKSKKDLKLILEDVMVVENPNVFDKLIETNLNQDLDHNEPTPSTCDDVSDDITEVTSIMVIDDDASLSDSLDTKNNTYNKISTLSELTLLHH